MDCLPQLTGSHRGRSRVLVTRCLVLEAFRGSGKKLYAPGVRFFLSGLGSWYAVWGFGSFSWPPVPWP